MLVVEGDRSFYLFSGSRREEKGEPKHYASYALQMAIMRHARAAGARVHDLWGIAPEEAGPEHPWYGVGLFKKGFGGRPVAWAGTWDIVVDRTLYRMRSLAAEWRHAARDMVARLRKRDR
jgi:lipid II:glycine glycyltransferase (peptidoglycan interpeptide bridge formation enzyme)